MLHRYNPLAPELQHGRLRARRLVKKYNDYFPDDATPESLTKDREAMLKEIIGTVGPRVYIDPPFHVDYGFNISFGADSYANYKYVPCLSKDTTREKWIEVNRGVWSSLTILDCGVVTVGERTLFGPGVSIFAATHETDVSSRRAGVEYAHEVTIGNDCWIGGHTVIMPGVTIGNGVTVGASSVVTNNIPSFSVAIGSPARVVKKVESAPDMPLV